MSVSTDFLYRDVLVMLASAVALFVFCIGVKGPGRLNRVEGAVMFTAYCVYTYFLVTSSFVTGN